VKEPVFGVKLWDTGTRVPVVLSKHETQQLFEKLQEQERREDRYELAAQLQYGAGMRLSEMVRSPRFSVLRPECEDPPPRLSPRSGAGKSG
jgi:site-specific recombinase XerD